VGDEGTSATHRHALLPLEITASASPYSTKRFSTVVTDAIGSLWRASKSGSFSWKWSDIARIHGTAGFHQNHATSFGEARLTSIALAVDQFH